MLGVAQSTGVPAFRQCGTSSRPALRKKFLEFGARPSFVKNVKTCLHTAGLFEMKCSRIGVWLKSSLEPTQPVASARVCYLECPCWKFVSSIPGSSCSTGYQKLGFEPTRPDAFARKDVLKHSWSEPTWLIANLFSRFRHMLFG